MGSPTVLGSAKKSMKARIKDFAFSLDGKQQITIETGEDFRNQYEKLHDQEISVEIKQYRKRRSLDANAYLWVLLDKIAVELSKESPVSPEDVYRQLIPNVGGNSKILPIREDAIEAWKSIWSAGRTGWLCEDMGPCNGLPGYHNIRCFYGSSIYDTAQMSRLINLTVQEAKQLEIETMTPEELEILKARWADER